MTVKTIGVLHGAILNGGDFLICKRGTQLLNKYLDSKFELVHMKRWESFEGNYDALIILGGPIIARGMFPQIDNIRGYLKNKEIPVIALGVGISGEDYVDFDDYFTDESLEFWQKVFDSSNLISVRDKQTYSLLNQLGIAARLTGCPALFDLDNIHKMDEISENVDLEKKKISFTIPNLYLSKNFLTFDNIRKIHNFFLSLFFISYMRTCFKLKKIEADYFLILQHGFNPLINLVHWYCKLWGIKTVDASNRSLDETEEILSSDIHIGTRLHAHILFSSYRKPSYLFDVDYRTNGFLDTFNSDYYIKFSLQGIITLVNLASKELKDFERIKNRIMKSNRLISEYFNQMHSFLTDLEKFFQLN